MAEPATTTVASVSLMTIAVGFFGPAFGPLAVIFASAVVGAMWALSRTPVPSRLQGALLMLRLVMTALVLTAAIAKLAAPVLGEDVRESFGFVAFGIGLLGDDGWKVIFEAAKSRIRGVFATAFSGGKP